MNLKICRVPCTRIGPSHGLYLYRTAQHRKTQTHNRASSGIQTHDPSVRAVKDHIRFRPRRNWDRHGLQYKATILLKLAQYTKDDIWTKQRW